MGRPFPFLEELGNWQIKEIALLDVAQCKKSGFMTERNIAKCTSADIDDSKNKVRQ